MARPVNPRSRSSLARVIGVPEATLRLLESKGHCEPVASWDVTDAVWARIACAPGVDATALPPVPKRIESDSWLLLPHGSGRNSYTGSLMQVTLALEEADTEAVVIPIGTWAREVGDLWL